MCCVMPPLSPLATSMPMILSNSDVLPWSTCPRNVITGGRGLSVSGRIGLLIERREQLIFQIDRLPQFDFDAQLDRQQFDGFLIDRGVDC